MYVETNRIVLQEYERYVQIQTADKQLNAEQVRLQEDSRRPKYQVGEFDVTFDNGQEEGTLGVRLNTDKLNSFAFQLFCRDLMPDACYRFESDGRDHTNPHQEGLSLRQRRVSTPHFHKFDQNGHVLAYKTDRLKAEEDKLLADMDEALRHFCEEENIQVSPALAVKPDALPIGQHAIDDPMEGGTYP